MAKGRAAKVRSTIATLLVVGAVLLSARLASADPLAGLARGPDSLVAVVRHPNVAYLLFVTGLVAAVVELFRRGTPFPGILGAITLALAIVGFDGLPINATGTLLILGAIGLFAGELRTGIGALAVAAITSLVLGSVLLYEGPTGVTRWVAVVTSGAVAMFFLVVVRTTFDGGGVRR